jgi:hypothetical protein
MCPLDTNFALREFCTGHIDIWSRNLEQKQIILHPHEEGRERKEGGFSVWS